MGRQKSRSSQFAFLLQMTLELELERDKFSAEVDDRTEGSLL
jgi:hypothetical protein